MFPCRVHAYDIRPSPLPGLVGAKWRHGEAIHLACQHILRAVNLASKCPGPLQLIEAETCHFQPGGGGFEGCSPKSFGNFLQTVRGLLEPQGNVRSTFGSWTKIAETLVAVCCRGSPADLSVYTICLHLVTHAVWGRRGWSGIRYSSPWASAATPACTKTRTRDDSDWAGLRPAPQTTVTGPPMGSKHRCSKGVGVSEVKAGWGLVSYRHTLATK